MYMFTTIFLTAEEKKLFNPLSDELKGDWEVQDEVINYEESAEKQRMRCKLMKLSDPELQKAFDEIQSIEADSQESFAKWVDSLKLAELNDDDINEIFYALGPVSISKMLVQMIAQAKNNEDIEFIAAIAAIRHVMFTPKSDASSTS